MRIHRVRTGPMPELGTIDLTFGTGMVGWSGGSARTRRLFVDLLRWALGIPVQGHAGGSWDRGGGLDEARVDVSIGGETIPIRPGADGSSGVEDGNHGLRARLGLSPQALAYAWTGAGSTEPEPLWRAGARLLAERRGLPRLEGALARLGASSDREGAGPERAKPPEVDPAAEAELAAVTLRLEELADVPERLRSLEAELRSLRADAAEVVGDLEVATMDWLRERQDAETHLQQYRDQARELRARMTEMEEKGPEGSCPYCGRPLGDHLEDVMAELAEEWDGLVQDGTWWRRRREQLELKPEELQELERRAVTLQSRVEDCAERLERCRFELREWDELRGRREELAALAGEDRAPPVGEADRAEDSGAETGGGDGSAGVAAAERRRNALLRALREAREDLLREERSSLTRSAGFLLNRISGGRIVGLVDDGNGRLDILEDGRVAGTMTVEDRAAAVVALQLALTLELVETGVPLESILVSETFRGMDPESRIRSVEVLRGLLDRIPQVLLLWGGEVVDAVPERFDQILEFRPDRDRPAIRSLPGGVGTLELLRS